jgi:hypothetical protein
LAEALVDGVRFIDGSDDEQTEPDDVVKVLEASCPRGQHPPA